MNSHFVLHKLQSKFYQLPSDFVRSPKFCKANIFNFSMETFQIEMIMCFLKKYITLENGREDIQPYFEYYQSK